MLLDSAVCCTGTPVFYTGIYLTPVVPERLLDHSFQEGHSAQVLGGRQLPVRTRGHHLLIEALLYLRIPSKMIQRPGHGVRRLREKKDSFTLFYLLDVSGNDSL